MRLKTLLLTISAILVINPCYAQEVIAELDETGKVVLNEELRNTRNLIKQNETAIVPFSRGGLGADIDAQSEGTIFVVDSTGIAAEGLAPGVSGQTLTISGSVPIWEYPSGGFTNMQVFTSSGTWTKPTGVGRVYVKAWGGGGEGTQAAAVVVNGHAGGNSSFAGVTTIQANGGGGGTATGGTGGTATGGTFNITGKNGTTNPGVTTGSSGGKCIVFFNYDGGATALKGEGYSTGGGGTNGVGESYSGGSGGGAGGYSEGFTDVTGNVTVTVGAGGTGNSAGDGYQGLVLVYWSIP